MMEALFGRPCRVNSGLWAASALGGLLSSGLVGRHELGFMFKFSFVIPAAWVLAESSSVLLTLALSPLSSAKAQDKLCWHSLYQNQVTWLQARS